MGGQDLELLPLLGRHLLSLVMWYGKHHNYVAMPSVHVLAENTQVVDQVNALTVVLLCVTVHVYCIRRASKMPQVH